MDKWNRKYIFEPGKIYQVGDTQKYFRFNFSELVLETYISYDFTVCDENCDLSWHEDNSGILAYLQLAPPAVQVLYGQTKERKT